MPGTYYVWNEWMIFRLFYAGASPGMGQSWGWWWEGCINCTAHSNLKWAHKGRKITFEDVLCSCVGTLIYALLFNTMCLWNLYCCTGLTMRKLQFIEFKWLTNTHRAKKQWGPNPDQDASAASPLPHSEGVFPSEKDAAAYLQLWGEKGNGRKLCKEKNYRLFKSKWGQCTSKLEVPNLFVLNISSQQREG